MDQPKCRTCGERHRAGPCPAHQSSRGGAESRSAGHIKGTGIRPSELGTVGKGRHRTSSGKQEAGTGMKRKATQTPGSLPSFGPTDSPQAGVAPGPREAKPSAGAKSQKPTKAMAAKVSGDRTGSSILPTGANPKRGRPLAKDKDKTAEAVKPWVAAEVSRATWYRRKAEAKK